MFPEPEQEQEAIPEQVVDPEDVEEPSEGEIIEDI